MSRFTKRALLTTTLLLLLQGSYNPVHSGDWIAALIETVFREAGEVEEAVERAKVQKGLQTLKERLLNLQMALDGARAETDRGRYLDENTLSARIDVLRQRSQDARKAVESIAPFLNTIEKYSFNVLEELSRILESINSWIRAVGIDKSSEERKQAATRAARMLEELRELNKALKKASSRDANSSQST